MFTFLEIIKNELILSFMNHVNHMVSLPVFVCAVALTIRLFVYCSLFLCVRIVFVYTVHTCVPKTKSTQNISHTKKTGKWWSRLKDRTLLEVGYMPLYPQPLRFEKGVLDNLY
jgi:hypothetical protein